MTPPSTGNRRSSRDPASRQARSALLEPGSESAARDTQSVPENPFPIVGVGASAGGLEAFKAVFAALPDDTGMAFVVVQHMGPQQDSLLAELLARSSRIPVSEIEDGVTIEPDRAYVIPPERDVVILDGRLKLVPRTKTRGLHMPIDYFLRTLADAQKGMAIAVVLSGTGQDGTLGVKAVKGAGGITFAQDPASAGQDGMPRSAIASGCVDLVLPPDGIAGELARLGRHPYVTKHLPAPRLVDPTSSQQPQPRERDGLAKVLAIVREATGADFSAYKRTTIERRVARRMALVGVEGLEEYARRLEERPEEVRALHQDCLISVTSFFRDPATFEALGTIALGPLLQQRRPRGQAIRAWVPGCATGEEAYSIAICLLESAAARPDPPALQIFASDISESALEKARTGVYLETIAQDVSPERLQRFFTRIDGGYQVSKAVRELCVFARHDVIKDPPFSRLDLISFRNVLIYLELELQQRVLTAFHYALNPRGFLTLGRAEGVGVLQDQFSVLDKQQRIFVRNEGAATPSFRWAASPMRRAGREESAPRPRALGPLAAAHLPGQADRILLARYAPAGVIVDGSLKILEFRGETAPYLEHPHGEAGLGLLRMAKKGLLHDLRKAVEDARAKGAPVLRRAVPLRDGQKLRRVDVEAIPLDGSAGDAGCLLVTFADDTAHDQGTQLPEPPPADRRTDASERSVAQLAAENASLRSELQESAQQLHSIMQQHERANEELQSANEEVLSANEELQSINEELETAKEELQSANEELSTLNQELQERNRQLGTVNDDLVNLLTSVNIPLVIVGPDLRLRRFTPAAERPFGLIRGDVGRPLSDLRSSFDTPKLEAEVLDTIETMQPREREVVDRDGRFHSLQIRPYRTGENRIEGAVIVLIDIDGLKRALEDANAIVETAREPLVLLDGDLRLERGNPSFCETLGVSTEGTEGRLLYDLSDGQWMTPDLRQKLQQVLLQRKPFEGYVLEHEFPGVGPRTLVLAARRLHYAKAGRERILLAIEDRTELRRATEERERLFALETEARQRAEEADRVKDEFVATLSHELRGPLGSMVGWVHVLQSGRADVATEARAKAAIERGVHAQVRLIDDLLDYSRLVKGKLRLSQCPTDLVNVAEAAIQATQAAATAKDISVELSRETARAIVLGDPDRLQQVAWNLLSNAVKFTPRGGRVNVTVRLAHSRFELSVSDDGRGISQAFLPHVFERFRQAEGRASRTEHGLGLGLAIVRNLVEMHGGTARAESPGEGHGSTFTVSFPVPPLLVGTTPEGCAEDATEWADAVRDAGGADLLEGVTVLVVEDEADGRQMLGALFEQSGAEVRYAASAAEALASFAQAVPDVMLCDIGLPGEDGYSLMRRVRALAPESGGRIPAMALTAYVGEESRRRAEAAGFDLHVGKPTAPVDLVNAIATLAGRVAGPPTGHSGRGQAAPDRRRGPTT